MITYYTKEGKFEVTDMAYIPWQKLHRINGPAVVAHNYYEIWYVNGKRHRLDGPAIMWPNDNKGYWVNGKRLNTKKVETWIKSNNINLKIKQHQSLFMLRFG